MSSLSSDAAGLDNYIIKRDLRRSYDREIRSEGHTGLVLSPSVNKAIQVTPPGSATPLTLIAQARRGDGKKLIIAGNAGTIWAFTGTEDMNYAENPATGLDDYFANDTGIYVDETQNGWMQIATGLAANANSWEAVQVGDFLCLNNGVDLPLTYRPGDLVSAPIYELREQQIACVGTIAVHNGILLAMDLTIINDADFSNLMAAAAGSVNASISTMGVVSVPAQTLFPGLPVLPGMTIFCTTGESVRIVAVAGDGTITTDNVNSIAQQALLLENTAAYAAFTDLTKTQRFPWRILPSMQGQPRRFGSIVPVSASLLDRQLVFEYPIRSLSELRPGNYVTSKLVGGAIDITVLFAGVGGSTLTTSVIGIHNDIAISCLIADPVLSPISNTGDTPSSLEASDAANSYAGTYIDLVDDGGRIIKALQLRDQIVVYKDTPVIFLGTFTGDNTSPYNFTRVAVANEGQSLRYRNTIVAGGGGFYGSSHIYAGQSAFYKFDLFTQTPTEIPEMQSAQQTFFDAASSNPEAAFVAENPLTREWIWGWADSGADDRAFCYDYAFKTCRTTSADFNAAAKVQHPTRGDYMLLFASDDGAVQRYGLWDAPVENPKGITVTLTGGNTATASEGFFTFSHVGKTILLASGELVAIDDYKSPTVVTYIGQTFKPNSDQAIAILPAIWHRNGLSYDSVLETGLGDMGAADSEKMVTGYVAITSSKVPIPQYLKKPNAIAGPVLLTEDRKPITTEDGNALTL